MAFQQLPDNRGMIYVPVCRGKDKKHPCRDCFACQWCSDERCRVCRQEGCRTKKGNKGIKGSG